jgi:hypothetical protein
MNHAGIRSAALSEAELQSERLRILAVMVFFAVFTLIVIIRLFGFRTATLEDNRLWCSLSLVLIVVAFEYWMLRRVKLALDTGERVPTRFWVFTTVFETALPALGLAFLPNEQIEFAYRPLASPALLVFFILIIMSVLRLSPATSILAGCSACVSYLCAALFLGWTPPSIGEAASFTQSAVTLNAITLLMGGVVGAAVSGQVRKHFHAALREAETKRKLDAVQYDLQIARSIQQSLLPQAPPRIPGFDIAGWNQPADDTGGDYFDWQTLADGRLIVSLADVTGHGIGPALLASVCRAYARSAFRATQDLKSALEHINEAFSADLTTGRFTTFVALVCWPGCPDVRLLSAGHGPLFLYSRADDEFVDINSHALPLGILPTFNCDPPSHLQLRTGDILLLSTDGFFEWENDQEEEFGIQRVQEVIRGCRDYSPSEIVAQLYESAREFSHGAEQKDDLTAVAIKRV